MCCGEAGDDQFPQPEVAAGSERPPGEGAVLRLVARQAAHRVLLAGRQGDRVGRVHGDARADDRDAEHVGDGVRVLAVGRAGGGRGAGQQGDGVRARGGGRRPRQAHRRHAHLLHVLLPVPALRPAGGHGQRRRHLRALGRRVRRAAAELPGAPGRRDGARPGALRHGRHLRVGRLRPRRARVGHALRPARAGLRRPRLGRQQRQVPPLGRLARLRLRRLLLPPVRPARRPGGGALHEGEHHLRRELGGVVGERAAAVRGLQRLHGVRVGRAAGGARVRAVRPRAPRVARAARARRDRALHRLLGRHAADLGVKQNPSLQYLRTHRGIPQDPPL